MQMSDSLLTFISESQFFAGLEPNKKPCMISKTYVSASSYLGSIQRTLTGESAANLLLHIKLYATKMDNMLAEYKNTKALFPCVVENSLSALNGFKTLLITYKYRPLIVNGLQASIQNIEHILKGYGVEIISEKTISN